MKQQLITAATLEIELPDYNRQAFTDLLIAVGEVLNWYLNRYLERNAQDDEDFTQNNRQIQPNTIVRRIMLKVLQE